MYDMICVSNKIGKHNPQIEWNNKMGWINRRYTLCVPNVILKTTSENKRAHRDGVILSDLDEFYSIFLTPTCETLKIRREICQKRRVCTDVPPGLESEG